MEQLVTSGRSFKELDCWRKMQVLRQEIFRIAGTFPSEEKYDLRSQIVRSSRSVTANIAEGHGRYHYQENIQFLRIARGSLTETVDHLSVALECAYISPERCSELEREIKEVERIINGYIRYLQKMKKG